MCDPNRAIESWTERQRAKAEAEKIERQRTKCGKTETARGAWMKGARNVKLK